MKAGEKGDAGSTTIDWCGRAESHLLSIICAAMPQVSAAVLHVQSVLLWLVCSCQVLFLFIRKEELGCRGKLDLSLGL